MFYNVLNSLMSSKQQEGSDWVMWLLVGFAVLVLVLPMILNRRSQQKRIEEAENTLNAIKPGNKVKTIGYICGVVVEVCPEDNTFVLDGVTRWTNIGSTVNTQTTAKIAQLLQSIKLTDGLPTGLMSNSAAAPIIPNTDKRNMCMVRVK